MFGLCAVSLDISRLYDVEVKIASSYHVESVSVREFGKLNGTCYRNMIIYPQCFGISG